MTDGRRVALVTGATDGLGVALALSLGRAGYFVLVHGRSVERLERTRVLLSEAGIDCLTFCADYESLASVRECAQRIRASGLRVDALINNAALGILDGPRYTVDGIERVFQVNYIAHVLLTTLVTDLLRGPASRVINIISGDQQAFDPLAPDHFESWDGLRAYAASKLALLTFTFDLSSQADGAARVDAIHPATLMPTKMVLGRWQPKSSIDDGVRNVEAVLRLPRSAASTGQYYFESKLVPGHPLARNQRFRSLLRETTATMIQHASSPAPCVPFQGSRKVVC